MRIWNFVLIAGLSLFMLRVVLCALVADGALVTVIVATERRKKLYSPVLSDRAIKSIFRMKRVLKKPMTEIADTLIQRSLKAVDKEVICETCISEKNNQCDECYLKKGGL